MSRWIAGVLSERAPVARPQLERALCPYRARTLVQGPLQLVYTGPPPSALDPLCMLCGHIDNAGAIRRALQAPDELALEQLLAVAYRRWGESLPARLRGDFLLLVWHAARGEGMLARDQLGVRCAYWHESGGSVRFAGEVAHLLGLLPRRPAPDPAGVAHWIAALPRSGSGTLYEGVRRLAPGSLLHLGGQQSGRTASHWGPTFREPRALTEPERSAALRAGLERAVERRLAPDGPTAVLLSGGLDSATVAALAATRAPGGVSACSGTFPEHPQADEAGLVALLRCTLDLAGVNAEVRAGGLLASALSYQRRWQLPLLSWGDFWTLPLLEAAAAAGAGIVLGGDGGDELFDARAFLLADRLTSAPREVLRLARELPGAGDRPSRAAVLRAAARFAVSGALPYRLHEVARRVRAGRDLPPWLRPAGARALAAEQAPLAWKRLGGPRWWAQGAHALARGIEATGIFELHRHRAALAGLEARHPLLDLDLVELVLAQDPLASFDRYRSRPALRAAMAGALPEQVRLRACKARFDSVIVETLAGPDAGAVRRLLCDPAAELSAYVELETVRRLLLDVKPGAATGPLQWMQHVWRLCTAECWLRAQSASDPEQLFCAIAPSSPRVVLFSTLTRAPAALDSLPA
jgi:asparagine synthase (glutamine-hydrolysing)